MVCYKGRRNTAVLGLAEILGNWAQQGYSAVRHCAVGVENKTPTPWAGWGIKLDWALKFLDSY